MCLFSKQGIFTTGSDIICYKVGEGSLTGITSPYKYFFFEFDKLYTDHEPEKIMECGEGHKIIEDGFFHAFTSEKAALKEAEDLNHGYGYKSNYKVFKAIIPKGTRYCEGTLDDICAKSIKILNEIEYEI